MKTPGEIAKLAQMACILEVCAPKPGNVSRHHDFANTSMLDFLLSAIAIGPAFEKVATHPIGEIVYEAIKATQQKANSNTNLGIVLLLAPLAKACYGSSDRNGIRGNLLAILKNLSVEDAQLAYAAIRLAKAGGMGKVSESDISAEPSITLMQAMNLAQDRDSIAREYATGFAIVERGSGKRDGLFQCDCAGIPDNPEPDSGYTDRQEKGCGRSKGSFAASERGPEAGRCLY
jgi:triphosphoribosyl-dephospho-CoA synthase